MTKLNAGLITTLPASDSGSAAVWGSKRINPWPQSCLCLTWSGYPSNNNDHNNVIHQFVCHCNSQYTRHTSQCLQAHIKQHVARLIRNHHSFSRLLSHTSKTNNTSQIIVHESTTGQHLFENPFCAATTVMSNSLWVIPCQMS